jgi:dinuclear metal center YbgI/SA1388 family protein
MTERPSIAQLLSALGRMAPWDKAASWDPVGLQLGDPAAPAVRVAVCHEVTEPVLEAVEAERPDLLVSYHPLLFRPTTRLVVGRSPSGRALRLVRGGVSLAVAHTNFDVAPGGASEALAEALMLAEVAGFGPLEGPDSVKVVTFVPAEAADRVADRMAAAGAGVIGNYTHCSFRTEGTGTFFAGEGTTPAAGQEGTLNREAEIRLEMVAPRSREGAVVEALLAAHPYEEPAYDVYDRRGEAGMLGRIGRPAAGATLGSLAELVVERLGADGMRTAGDPRRELTRVAVVPGSGGQFLAEAAGLGADLMVTGDVSHQQAAEALDQGLAVIDPGHVASERPGVQRLYAAVAKVAPEAVDLTDLDPSPFA